MLAWQAASGRCLAPVLHINDYHSTSGRSDHCQVLASSSSTSSTRLFPSRKRPTLSLNASAKGTWPLVTEQSLELGRVGETLIVEATTSSGQEEGWPSSSESDDGSSQTSRLTAEQKEVTAARQRIFDRIAPEYDKLNDWLSLGQHRIWKRMAVKWSRASEGHSVLDLCCGSGDIAFLLAEKVGLSGSVTGLDFAPEQLAVAAERQADSYYASKCTMRWIEGNALQLPFKAESFDAATMGYGLRNVADIPLSLREMYRVLKPGASVAILDFNHTTDPLVDAFQSWTLDNVVVPVATQFGLEEEYRYLRPSIQRFPTGREQVRLAKEAGFAEAEHYDIAGKLMGMLVARKS